MNQYTPLSLNVKKEIHSLCISTIKERIEHDLVSMDKAQQAANQETKSSVGNKYETGRAMMQLEREKYVQQLKVNQRALEFFSQLSPLEEHNKIQIGSIIITDQGNFYLSMGIGSIEIQGTTFQTLSLNSPLGKEFMHKKSGTTFSFRNKDFEILGII